MNTYAIRRKNAWETPEELKPAAERSKQVADSYFVDDSTEEMSTLQPHA